MGTNSCIRRVIPKFILLPAAILKRNELLLAIGINCNYPKFIVHINRSLHYTVMESEQAIIVEPSRSPSSDSKWGQEKASWGSVMSIPWRPHLSVISLGHIIFLLNTHLGHSWQLEKPGLSTSLFHQENIHSDLSNKIFLKYMCKYSHHDKYM